jgi:AmmeMemoRadiSam system protein B
MWQHIFSQVPTDNFTEAPGGVVLPHHMIVGNELSKTYQKLAKVMNPSLVVIVSPNHYEAGNSAIQTCLSCQYQTIGGETPIDTLLAQRLIKSGLATNKPSTFANEHGIHSHTPFIKKLFPQAQILPIALKWETSPEKTIELSNWLDKNIPRDALVIASVDFSHYIPVDHAKFHDVTSHVTIQNFNYDNIYDLEIDSPPSISTIAHLMEKRGYMRVDRFAHTNNQDFQSASLAETTSHQFIGFFKGEKQLESTITITALGAITPDQVKNDDGTSLGFYDNYRWNINSGTDMMDPRSTKLNQYLRDFRGKEDRMLVGSNFLIFNGLRNLTDNTCIKRSENGIHISFCRLAATSKNQGDNLKIWRTTLDKEKSMPNEDRFYYIVLDTPEQYITPLASIYKNRLIIAPELGDFIASPTTDSTSGKMAEITITPTSTTTKLSPIEIPKGYPYLKR